MWRRLSEMLGGALGANIVGNKEPVEKVNVLKFVNTLMNV